MTSLEHGTLEYTVVGHGWSKNMVGVKIFFGNIVLFTWQLYSKSQVEIMIT